MNQDGRIITDEIRKEAWRRLSNFYRPFTDQDRWNMEDRIARERDKESEESAG